MGNSSSQSDLDAKVDDGSAGSSSNPDSTTNDITAEYHVPTETSNGPPEIAEDALHFEEERKVPSPTLDVGSTKSEKSEKSESESSDSSIMAPEIVDRLLGSVSLGYGAFQLAISLIPPKILKVMEFFGFEGDRDAGLKALEVASHSKDMKAPLAS